MHTSTAKTADELLIEMADAFIPALDQAKCQNHEDGERFKAIGNGELMNVWEELRGLATKGAMTPPRLLDSHLDNRSARN